MPLPSSQAESAPELSATLDVLLQTPEADTSQFWRQQRSAYQRGLLVWLKTPEDAAGLPQMQASVHAALTRAIAVPEIDEHSESWISFWQAVVTLFDCLGERQLTADMAVRRLITRVDQHFRRQEANTLPPEAQLLDELRHCIAPFRQTSKIEEALEQADFEIESLELANAEPDIPVLGTASNNFPPLLDDLPSALPSIPFAELELAVPEAANPASDIAAPSSPEPALTPNFDLEAITLTTLEENPGAVGSEDEFDLILDLPDISLEHDDATAAPAVLTAPVPALPPAAPIDTTPPSTTLPTALPDVVAGILPLFASARSARYSPEKAEPWKTACAQLKTGWEQRRQGLHDFRSAVFGLCAAAVALNDPECLRLAEALATASDKLELEGGLDHLPLTAAITATLECLGEPDNLEHPAFADRVRHLAGRLEQCAHAPFSPALSGNTAATPQASPRSPTIDRLFAEEANEHLDNLHAALDAVPPQASDAADALRQLAAQADALEIDAISSLGHDLADVLDQLALHASSEDWRILALDLEDILKKQVDTVANGLTPVPQVLEAPLLGALRQLAGTEA